MNRKIMKALYSDVVGKDPIRPVMCGVYFEEECCIASDTHILVLYHESDPRFVGKIMSKEGEEIKGTYPNARRVIPTEDIDQFRGDLAQLYKACQWWCKQSDANEEDMVIFGTKVFVISYLKRLLGLYAISEELKTAKMFLEPEARPAKITSPTFTGMIMPCSLEDLSYVDAPREDGFKVVVSYANLINTFALESSKPKVATPSALDWL